MLDNFTEFNSVGSSSNYKETMSVVLRDIPELLFINNPFSSLMNLAIFKKDIISWRFLL